MALASGCRGRLVATAELHGPGTAEVKFQSTGAPLSLWADTEGAWRGARNFPAHYEIDVLAGGSKTAHLTCDTKDSRARVCGSHVQVGAEGHGSCELKLGCNLPSIPPGPAALQVSATLGAGASNVKNMSLNVREK